MIDKFLVYYLTLFNFNSNLLVTITITGEFLMIILCQ